MFVHQGPLIFPNKSLRVAGCIPPATLAVDAAFGRG